MRVIIRRPIFSEHVADLKKSGISKAFAQLNELYSVDREGLSRLIDKPVNLNIKSALIFRYSHTKDFFHAKVFPPYIDKNGKKAKYLQRPGSGTWFYIPSVGSKDFLKDSDSPLTIIEGEKKALAALEKGVEGVEGVIGISGIWGGIKDHSPINDFSLVNWKRRKAIFVPDGDVWAGNRNLLQGVFAFCRFMEDAGADVHIVNLSELDSTTKIGLDDFLLHHSIKDFHKLPKIDLSHEIFLGLEDWYASWINKSNKLNKKEDITLNQLIYPATPINTQWPISLPVASLHGLAGDFVRLIDPATEADPMAIYTQFLVMFGNIVGRFAHFVAEEDKHYMNSFIVLIGETSKGRKGSSLSQVKKVFTLIDEKWLQEHEASGLSSGEGLIWAVRDPIEKTKSKKDKKTGQTQVVIDEGIKDKRLVIFEPELASALRVLEREGNTLSSVIRQAWDSGTLRSLTKNSPAKATNAHISIIGHITKTELKRYLNRTEIANGFGNRFLWLCVKRSKCLPEGGTYDKFAMVKIINRLRDAISFSTRVQEMHRSEKAKNYWRKIYAKLSEGKHGLVGALTARAEAQVMRFSCLFALLDNSRIVRKHHLEAAIDLWNFSHKSVEHIFGESIGDDVADRIYTELVKQPNGLTLSEISALFSNHKIRERIQPAIQSLLSMSLVRWEDIPTSGRPKRVIKAILK